MFFYTFADKNRGKLKNGYYIFIATMMALLCSCSATKFIPDGEYMLDRVVIKSDKKDFDARQLEPYIRQKGNSRWFSSLKIPLATYSLSGRDTTKWINRTLQKMGEQPVIYDSVQAQLSCKDLQTAMQNMGYMNGTVSLKTTLKGKKKLRAYYTLHPGEPFHIRHFNYDIQDSVVERVLQPILPKGQEAKERFSGMPFTVSSLDAERKRLTKYLNDNGYYRFHKDFIHYSADSTFASRQVDITLHLMPYKANNDAPEMLHPRYRIGKVTFEDTDSTTTNVRRSVLENTTAIEEGKYFSATDLQKTYNNFGRLGAIRYTNIHFKENEENEGNEENKGNENEDNGERLLDCDIHFSTNKTNTISFQPEGTNTAGDLGAAASLTWQNRNLFHGSELFSIQLRAAYEAITGLEGYDNHNYLEYGIESRLQFPRFLAPFLSKRFKRRSTATSELSVGWNMQNRPEFHRRMFTAAWRYKWGNSTHTTTYNFDLLDLNYIYMPWVSETFKKNYIDEASSSRNAILRYNYEDLFIMRTGFGIIFSNNRQSVRVKLESAGNLLYALSPIVKMKKNNDNQYKLFNIAYAQYVKFDIDYTRQFKLIDETRLVLHAALGIAYPYGNSKVLPFEKRYFSGGANSVRGWSVRELGPGSFRGTDGKIDFINQTGDMKIDLNAEVRTPLFWKFSGAVFVDVGNIWTLRAYDEQPGGQFRFDTFYKQLAASYGLGLRLNFDYFVLRFDAGMKAMTPVYDNSREHFPIFHPVLSRDFTFHFAVGMPF